MNSKNFGTGKFGFGPGIGHDGRGAVNGYRIGGGVPLRGAKLYGADLRGADLCGENLEEADLRGADLRGADLSGANLTNARLEGAEFRGADLEDASLAHARLAGADLSGAYLEGANLVGADLTDARVSPHHVGAILDARKNSRLRVGDDQEDPLTESDYTPTPYGWRPDPNAAGQNMFDDTLGLDLAFADRILEAGSRNNFYGPNGELPPLPVNRNTPGRTPNPGQGTRRGPGGYKY